MNGWLWALVVIGACVLVTVCICLAQSRGKRQAAQQYGATLGMGDVRSEYAREQFDRNELDADIASMHEDYAQRAARREARKNRKGNKS